MRRREFITLLGSSAVAWPLSARAQQPERVRRVGVLMGLPADNVGGRAEAAALRLELEHLGWKEGRNLEIRYSWSEVAPDRIQIAAKELLGRDWDVIVGRSTPGVAALLKETRTIPIVFVVVVDPVGSGFVQSFSRPGGNVTGFQNYEFTMVGKWLEMLLEIAPSLRQIAYLYNPSTAPKGFLQALGTIAPSASVQLVAAPVRNAADVDAAFAGFAGEPRTGVMAVPDIWLNANRVQLISQAAKHRVPVMYPSRQYIADAGLISYGPDTPDLFRRAASYVDRILKGEKPADLPVQAPTKYELVINLKTAKALGLTVPPSLLTTADEVIE